MTNVQKTKVVKTKKKKLSKAAIVLIVGLIIIAIPTTILAGILISSSMNTGKPIFGERYANDLNPAISETNITNVKSLVEAIEGVEKVEVILPSGQLRVNVDVRDDMTKDEIVALCDTVYAKVQEELSLETYFTSTEEKRMYDLAITAYNNLDAEDDSLIQVQLTKNAMMSDKLVQVVSEPVNPGLTEQLIEAQKEPVAEQPAEGETQE